MNSDSDLPPPKRPLNMRLNKSRLVFLELWLLPHKFVQQLIHETNVNNGSFLYNWIKLDWYRNTFFDNKYSLRCPIKWWFIVRVFHQVWSCVELWLISMIVCLQNYFYFQSSVFTVTINIARWAYRNWRSQNRVQREQVEITVVYYKLRTGRDMQVCWVCLSFWMPQSLCFHRGFRQRRPKG